MKIKTVSLTGVRGFVHAEFTFRPGINLLVGINGVGKTTVLDALRVCLSAIFPEITASRNKRENFRLSDIKIGQESLDVTCVCEIEGKEIILSIHKSKSSFKINNPEDLRDGVTQLPDIIQTTPEDLRKFLNPFVKVGRQPICVYFSTRRSLMVDQKISKSTTAGGQAAAFAEALSPNREFNLRGFAEWSKAQEELGKENPGVRKNNQILNNAVSRFLPGFSHLALEARDGSASITIEKAGTVIPISQLSDGERGVLALVLDIARRLTQANPGLEDPLKDGTGIVLIDELDLHLHPQWQRTIIEHLTATFPHCQFIVTTHSPQLIGEVNPENITIINNGTHHPTSSFGVDSSRVLEEILDTAPRNEKVNTMLGELYKSIDNNDLAAARKQLEKLTTILGPVDPEVARSGTMIRFLEDDLENETDNKA